MTEFQVVPATRISASGTKHGFVVERRVADELPVAFSEMYESAIEAESEAVRLAKFEGMALSRSALSAKPIHSRTCHFVLARR